MRGLEDRVAKKDAIKKSLFLEGAQIGSLVPLLGSRSDEQYSGEENDSLLILEDSS